MSNLAHRQSKIQEKRNNTPRKEFVMDICGRQPISFYKNKGHISRFPLSDRQPNIEAVRSYSGNSAVGEYSGDMFADFYKLFTASEVPALMHFNNPENSDFSDTVVGSTNVYLSNTVTFASENVCYSIIVRDNCSNIYNSHNILKNSQNIYQSEGVISSSNVFYSKYIIDSNGIYGSSNLVSCEYCIDCHDMEHKKYHIHNEPVSADEFHTYLNKLDKHLLEQTHHTKDIKGIVRNVDDYSGNFLENIHHCYHCYGSMNIHRGNNIIDTGANDLSEDFYDVFSCGRSQHFYGVLNSGAFSEHVYCSINIGRSSHIYYCYYLENCSFCLGCVSLKNKSYCIFNKQYTKEERYEKVDEIFGQMERDGTLGQFFPATMNPFYFNDTAAYLIDPSFTKEEVTAKGYLRRDEPIKVDIPEGMKIITIDELENYEGRITNTGEFLSLPQIRNSQSEIKESYNRTINADILKVTIQDEQGNYYRIIPMEYKFLVKHGLPLPRKHRLERMKENFRIS